jgi:hypothetical protein
MPLEVRDETRADEFRSSGAIVASLTVEARFEEPYIEDGGVLHSWNREELCAPFFVGCRYGPSTCAPRRDADPGMSRGARDGRIWDSQYKVI